MLIERSERSEFEKTKNIILTIFLITLLSACVDKTTDSQHTPAIITEKFLQAVQEVYKDAMIHSTTDVEKITYSSEKGDDIYYYFCKTTYYDEPDNITGVHLDAIKSVIYPQSAESSRETKVGDRDAVIYTLNGREYLCWTLSPEDNCILEYTPGDIAEEKIFKMGKV